MGFVSYLEDLISNSNDFEHFLMEYNQTEKNKIDIQRIFEFRKECIQILQKIKNSKIENFDQVIDLNIKLNEENKRLKSKNIQLNGKYSSSDSVLRNNEKMIEDLRSELSATNDKLQFFEQNSKNESDKREDFEKMIDLRYQNIYNEKIRIIEIENSEQLFTLNDSIKIIKTIITENQFWNNSDNLSRLKYIIKKIEI